MRSPAEGGGGESRHRGPNPGDVLASLIKGDPLVVSTAMLRSQGIKQDDESQNDGGDGDPGSPRALPGW